MQRGGGVSIGGLSGSDDLVIIILAVVIIVVVMIILMIIVIIVVIVVVVFCGLPSDSFLSDGEGRRVESMSALAQKVSWSRPQLEGRQI